MRFSLVPEEPNACPSEIAPPSGFSLSPIGSDFWGPGERHPGEAFVDFIDVDVHGFLDLFRVGHDGRSAMTTCAPSA
jgi:hypothetical protein